MTDSEVPAKYDVAKVEAVVLEVAVELHPRHLTARELASSIVGDGGDEREVETAARAIGNLREYGLLSTRGEDEIVRPTPAALRAVALLT